MIIKKGDKETIVFGYGDVVVKTKTTGSTGFAAICHSEEIHKIGDSVEVENDNEIVNFRFDNAESITVLIGALKKVRKYMNKSNGNREFIYKIDWKIAEEGDKNE